MELYSAKILDERRLDPASGRYVCDSEITKTEVYKLAGGISRSTLNNSYHSELRRDLDDLIKTLKAKTGRGRVGKDAAAKASGVDATNRRTRTATKRKTKASATASHVNQLAETVAALTYRIIELERENDQLRSAAARNVVALPSASRRRT